MHTITNLSIILTNTHTHTHTQTDTHHLILVNETSAEHLVAARLVSLDDVMPCVVGQSISETEIHYHLLMFQLLQVDTVTNGRAGQNHKVCPKLRLLQSRRKTMK